MPDVPVAAHVSSSGPLYPFRGATPRIAEDAWVAPTAAVIGDVEIGAGANVWFHCVLRGDINFIRVGAGSNVQDGTIVHVSGPLPTVIGENVTIGHACIIHACTLKDGSFVGMGATVLDGATIEEGGMLAAGGLLAPNKVIGPNELWAGSPARFLRIRSAEDRERFDTIAPRYVALLAQYRLDGLETPPDE